MLFCSLKCTNMSLSITFRPSDNAPVKLHRLCASYWLHVDAGCKVKRELARWTSDTRVAPSSSVHQRQRDALIDAWLMESVYAPDRKLEWTFPPSIRHRQGPLLLVFAVEDRRKIKTWADLTGCWSHCLLPCLHPEPVSDLILRGWLWWGGRGGYSDNRWQKVDRYLYVWGAKKLYDGKIQYFVMFWFNLYPTLT